jgi:hypothetical protein
MLRWGLGKYIAGLSTLPKVSEVLEVEALALFKRASRRSKLKGCGIVHRLVQFSPWEGCGVR